MKLLKFEAGARSYGPCWKKHPKFEQATAVRYSLACPRSSRKIRSRGSLPTVIDAPPQRRLAAKARERLKVLQGKRDSGHGLSFLSSRGLNSGTSLSVTW